MPYQPKESVKLYYTIGEVAGIYGVNTSLIRYYEQEFDIIKPHKNKKGNRLFTQKDLESFNTIFSLIRDSGFTLAETREAISKGNLAGNQVRKNDPNEEVVRRLNHVRKLLEEMNQKLNGHQ
ncbi:MAG TPA: MerR family transcriptional regulator [Bacteroidales bacterium]|nr:MerR family transcriptional regulator [Bacteroidales bacterium]HRZ48930.1 MerR family transcriptional regulator [Bacteroidales bacterium]